MKLLLHACCGPCSVYPVDALRAEGIEPRLFFKNPNVHPYLEFTKRIEAFRLFCEKRNVDFIVDDEYDIEGWLRTMVFREAQRCRLCYRMRLTAAARVARRGKFVHPVVLQAAEPRACERDRGGGGRGAGHFLFVPRLSCGLESGNRAEQANGPLQAELVRLRLQRTGQVRGRARPAGQLKPWWR